MFSLHSVYRIDFSSEKRIETCVAGVLSSFFLSKSFLKLYFAQFLTAFHLFLTFSLLPDFPLFPQNLKCTKRGRFILMTTIWVECENLVLVLFEYYILPLHNFSRYYLIYFVQISFALFEFRL